MHPFYLGLILLFTTNPSFISLKPALKGAYYGRYYILRFFRLMLLRVFSLQSWEVQSGDKLTNLFSKLKR